MLTLVKAWLRSDSAKRVARTFVIAFVAALVPGFLGWLHAFTAWANSHGQQPFPNGSTLAYLAMSAIAAGVTAVVNLIVNIVEDTTGRGFLRTPTRPSSSTPVTGHRKGGIRR